MKNTSMKFKFHYILCVIAGLSSMVFTLVLLFLLFFFNSCSQQELKKENANITFVASIAPATKSTTPFPAGNKAMIHAYNAADLSTPLAGTPSLATAQNNSGVTSLVTSPSINLLKGNYDFYCVTTNTATDPGITFTNGKSCTLSNNIDYLYASNKGVSVSSNTNVPFEFNHATTQLTFKLSTSPSLSISKLVIKEVSMKFPSPQNDQQGKMDLATGVITPVTTFAGGYTKITSENTNYTCIVLPVSKTANTSKIMYQVLLDMTISGTQYTDRLYNISVTLPERGLEAGVHYIYTGVIGANEITFSTANIANWIDKTIEIVDLEEIPENSAEADYFYIKKVYRELGQIFNENEPISTLPGITLTGNRITGITLTNGTLSGTLSPYLAKIRQLNKIDVSGNNLTGNIPAELATLPLSILKVYNNLLAGEVPTEILLMPLWEISLPEEDLRPQKKFPLQGFYTFIFEVQTTATDNALDISATPFTGANIKIDWGDRQIGTYSASPAAHTYSAPGTYTVKIDGKITGLEIHSKALKKILKFKDLDNEINNVSFSESGLKNIECPLITPKITNFLNCFNSCSGLTSLPVDLFKYNTA
ncbi:MAG: fimbrillin family protein, partial [Bacteroidales bacterium]